MAKSRRSLKTTSLPSTNDEAGTKRIGNKRPSAQCPGCGGPPSEAVEYRDCEKCRLGIGKIASISILLRLEEVHGQMWNPQMPRYDHALRMKWLQLRQLADTVLKRHLDGSQLLDEIHAITMPNASRNDFLNSTIESVMGLLRKLPRRRKKDTHEESTEQIPLNSICKQILKALEGKCLKVEELANIVTGGDSSRLYKSGLKKILEKRGLAQHSHDLGGWYRPDRPPPNSMATVPKLVPKEVANN